MKDAEPAPTEPGSTEDAPVRDLPVAVDDIQVELVPEKTADSATLSERDDLEHQEQKARIDDLKQETELRKEYAEKTFSLTKTWLLGISGLLLLEGFGTPFSFFDLPDNVLIAAIGGTTVTVTGLFVVVVRYLFPGKALEANKGDSG